MLVQSAHECVGQLQQVELVDADTLKSGTAFFVKPLFAPEPTSVQTRALEGFKEDELAK